MKLLHMNSAGAAVLGVLVPLAAPTGAQAEDSGFSVGVGAEYTTGKYGGETAIEETYVPVSLAYDATRLSVRLTVPYLSVKAPQGTVVEGPDGEQIIGEGPVSTEGGIGDVIAALTVYDVLSFADGEFVMDLTGEIKFGTADEKKGLGTGQSDYSVQADAFRFFGRVTAIGSVGYMVRGDPDDIDLEDVFFAAAGATCAVSDRTRLGIFYDYQEASVPGNDAMQELSATISSRSGESWWLSGYATAGFSDSSPDWGGGISFTASF
jgi:hypothetical protein